MGKGTLTKVMKYELCYKDGCGDFYNMQREVWALQRQTREVLNRSTQMAVHWDYMDREYYEKTGEHLDVKAETGYKRYDGHIYNVLKVLYQNMASKNLISTIQKSWKKYNSSKEDVLKGIMSLPSYKRDQPIILNKNNVKLYRDGQKAMIRLTLFSDKYKNEHPNTSNLCFSLCLNDNTQKAIFSNVLDKKYSLGDCQLVYKRPKWFFYLAYNFPPVEHELDPDKILGVDMGESCAIYASSFGEHGWLKISGGEITEFDKRMSIRKCAAQDRRVSEFAEDLEEQVHSRQNQAAHCGEGRIGHGTKTRVASVYKTKNRISNYRNTINHRYSKALVDYAVKNRYGTIQMEKLSGIQEDIGFPKFLRHWTYYDLQHKIEYKAKEHGITVTYINPCYTSQRCSQCGNIDDANRPSQAQFRCTKCGFSHNADYNASQNISIRDIEKIIEKERGAKPKKS